MKKIIILTALLLNQSGHAATRVFEFYCKNEGNPISAKVFLKSKTISNGDLISFKQTAKLFLFTKGSKSPFYSSIMKVEQSSSALRCGWQSEVEGKDNKGNIFSMLTSTGEHSCPKLPKVRKYLLLKDFSGCKAPELKLPTKLRY